MLKIQKKIRHERNGGLREDKAIGIPASLFFLDMLNLNNIQFEPLQPSQNAQHLLQTQSIH